MNYKIHKRYISRMFEFSTLKPILERLYLIDDLNGRMSTSTYLFTYELFFLHKQLIDEGKI